MLAAPAILHSQSLEYAPAQGEPFRYRTRNQLTVTQQILERENFYTLRADGVVRLTLMNPGERLLWRLGYEELSLRIDGAFPTPRIEALRGTVVTLATTPRGEVLDALGVALDSEHLDPVPLELEGQRLAEAAEAEHDHAAGVGDVLSQ